MRRSGTCKSKHGPKLVFSTEAQALDFVFAEGLKDRPYQCTRCHEYHLSDPERSTPSTHCASCDKNLYQDEATAKRRAQITRKEQGVALKVYRCPDNPSGWHLTKK